MIAKSLDILVALKFVSGGVGKTYAQLSKELGLSASEVHASVRRCIDAGLLDEATHSVRRKPLEDYLLHGVRYAFPAKRGPVVRGVPTAYAAPPLSLEISADDLPPVWADPDGDTKGYAVEPLYRSAPQAAKADPPQQADRATAACHREAGRHFIVGAGCEIPRGTADDKVHALRRYTRENR